MKHNKRDSIFFPSFRTLSSILKTYKTPRCDHTFILCFDQLFSNLTKNSLNYLSKCLLEGYRVVKHTFLYKLTYKKVLCSLSLNYYSVFMERLPKSKLKSKFGLFAMILFVKCSFKFIEKPHMSLLHVYYERNIYSTRSRQHSSKHIDSFYSARTSFQLRESSFS
jgi:hypothetical protein